jgi:hypothetical protein
MFESAVTRIDNRIPGKLELQFRMRGPETIYIHDSIQWRGSLKILSFPLASEAAQLCFILSIVDGRRQENQTHIIHPLMNYTQLPR